LGHRVDQGRGDLGFANPGKFNILAWKDYSDGSTNRQSTGGSGGHSGSGSGSGSGGQSSGGPGSNGIWQSGVGTGSGSGQSNKTGPLNNSNNIVNYRNGGDPSFVHKIPGRSRYSDVTLKRGAVDSSQLGNWFNSVAKSSKSSSTKSNNDPANYRSGGDHSTPLKLPGGNRLNDVTFKRGVVNSSQLGNWLNSVAKSSKTSSNKSNNDPWNIKHSKLPNLNDKGSDISIPEFNPGREHLTIP
jgi:hypothetical protein